MHWSLPRFTGTNCCQKSIQLEISVPFIAHSVYWKITFFYSIAFFELFASLHVSYCIYLYVFVCLFWIPSRLDCVPFILNAVNIFFLFLKWFTFYYSSFIPPFKHRTFQMINFLKLLLHWPFCVPPLSKSKFLHRTIKLNLTSFLDTNSSSWSQFSLSALVQQPQVDSCSLAPPNVLRPTEKNTAQFGKFVIAYFVRTRAAESNVSKTSTTQPWSVLLRARCAQNII